MRALTAPAVRAAFPCRSYLGERHPGHGVTFATGTPVSNTMVEMYTMQRFLDPAGLKSRGLEHFDAWAATFGEVIDTMEISPDGASLRPRSRFAKFTNPTPWGYSVYGDVTENLVAAGIPRSQIAAIGDADSDAKKQALFEKVRSGTVRVLIGSTQKMGTGTNVQQRLVALHHLDAPWKPAEVEQREGRILRQGNTNEEVAVYRYVTEGSFDAYMWQALETKARFIGQVITGHNAARRAEDVGGQELSYAEVKAIASGNPAVLTLAEADAELQRLAQLKKNHVDEQYVARRNVRDLPGRIARFSERLAGLEADQGTVRGVYVFDVSQTDGEALPEPARVNGDPRHHTDHLKTLIVERGITLDHADVPHDALGVSRGGRISIRPDLEPAVEFSVLAHELAHELLHRGEDRPASKTVRETEAEAVAFVVCQAIGLETGSAASDYIQLFDGKTETLAGSLDRIQTTAAEIIAALQDAPDEQTHAA